MTIMVQMGFEDTCDLMPVLSRNVEYDVSYTDERMAKPPSRQAVWIGAAVPFTDTKTILLEALQRYEHLKYFKLSTDYIWTTAYIHNLIFIGGHTGAAKEWKIQPIKPTDMISELERMESAEQLAMYVRSFYTGEFESWSVDDVSPF
ncbi:MAG: hypothetical protein ACR2RD_18160 [Woeseiaceae bacterium]